MLRLFLLTAWLAGQIGALPYIPTTALTDTNSSVVYVFQPGSDSSSASLIVVNTSTTVTPNSPVTTLSSAFPFLSNGEDVAFTPFVDSGDNIYALAGQCAQGSKNTSLWTLKSGEDEEKGNWVEIDLKVSEFGDGDSANSGGINFLASGFAFSSPPDHTPTLYSFGGMCPNASVSSLSTSSWQSSANYSNTLISASPQGLLSSSSFASVASKDDHFQLSPVTSSRGPPIAEAGFSVTGLAPLADSPNSTNVQQNLVLIGGQTAEAFINMSQVALLSLPEQSWSFLPITGAQSGTNELVRRQTPAVEPRSGHTAVLSEDGKRIIVLGGWVGDVNTPAEPQLAVLEVGSDYGGNDNWQWSIPSVSGTGPSGNGIYGHGAVLLPGNTMMIVGGNSISGQGSKMRRDAMGIHFFNLTSSTWSTNYANPAAVHIPSQIDHTSSGLKTGSKIGLGVGLGVGIPLFFAVLACVFCFRARQKRKDKRRSDIIDRALNGSDNFTGGAFRGSARSSLQSMVETSPGNNGLLQGHGVQSRESTDSQGNGWRNARSVEAERTGLLVEIPSPTRGLRKSHHSRGGSTGVESTGRASTQIPVIDEMDENEQEEHADVPDNSPFKLPELDLGAAFTAPKSPPPASKSPPPKINRNRPLSDPFADPLPPMPTCFDSAPSSAHNTPNESPDRNSKGWIEDWEAVQDSIQHQESAKRSSDAISPQHLIAARVSPLSHRENDRYSENSDRTRSNISDNSMHSAVSFITDRSAKSNPSLNRHTSQRSTNLFSVRPQRTTRGPARTSLPQPGTVSTAVATIEGTPPGHPSSSTRQGRSIALGAHSANNSPAHPRMPSFGTLQTESQALLGGPRSGATPATHLDQGTNVETHGFEFMDGGEDDEFPRRQNQRRSRGLMGSLHNVLGARSRNRLNTGMGSISSLGAPTVATVSSSSPTRASTSTPFSMLRAGGPDTSSPAQHNEQQPQPPPHSQDRGNSSGPRRTASVGSAPWRRRRSGARDWNWAERVRLAGEGGLPGEGEGGAHPSAPSQHQYQSGVSGARSDNWRMSSPGALTTGSMRDDDASGRSENGADWDVESAVERRCVQVMFTVPRERLRVVNASDNEIDAASVRTRDGHAESILDMYVDKPEDAIQMRGGGRDFDDYDAGEEVAFARQGSKHMPGRGSPGLW